MQKTIDWLYWQMLDSVEPWQAAALAAGMNPDALLHERHSWMSYPGAVIFQDKSFSGADEKERFEKLWNLAKSRADARQRVALPEFASFLVSHEWPGVPEPLRMMAKGAAPVMQQPEPHPAPAAQVEAVQAGPASSSKARRDLMTPVIEAAQSECKNPFDASQVWPVLVRMCKDKRVPMQGQTEDGIQWIDGEDELQLFSMKNLRDRLRRGRERLARAR